MSIPRLSSRRARLAGTAALVAAALAGLAPAAQARNVRLMEPVPDAVRSPRIHQILGTLDLRFGSDSARRADILRRDVAVKGVGTTKLHDVGDDNAVRPSDHDLCARAFEDAITQLAFAARGARAVGIVGVVSNYDGQLFDDPGHYECHVGALKAAVELKAQLVRSLDVPVAPPPRIEQPKPDTVPIVSPPAPQPGDIAPPAPPTFQPLPPVPAPSPSN